MTSTAMSVQENTPHLANSTIILLEDSQYQIDSVRRAGEGMGFQLLAASDWQTAVSLSDAGARFFILDVKLGDEPERMRAGLDALEVLRSKHGNGVFVALHTALKIQQEKAVDKADLFCEKSGKTEADLRLIVAGWERWSSTEEKSAEVQELDGQDTRDFAEEPANPDLLFPSDSLAQRIAGASDSDLARILRERRRFAAALGEKAPVFDDLVREIGGRMREELRGALRELAEAEEPARESENPLILASGTKLSRNLVRLILRFLPIAFDVDNILDDLRAELYQIAACDYAGEWGRIKGEGENVVLAHELKEC